MGDTFTLPLVPAGDPAEPGHEERARIIGLVDSGLSFTQIRRVLDLERVSGTISEAQHERLRAALGEWALAIIMLDTSEENIEEEDEPVSGNP
jgi:hypothetical protein